ncbi:MAG: endonuclease V [Deltaproteobacteria bacterium]|nr:endonuclease V [Deltaproteobacteria bacterium]
MAPGDVVQNVAGVDVAYDRSGRWCAAAAAILSWPHLRVVGEAVRLGPVEAPYRPGDLAAREAGPILGALRDVAPPPDLVLVDGHGLAHPRRRGLACAVGEGIRVPTVGVAKEPLVGRWAPPLSARGAWAPVQDQGEMVGAVVRTRADVKPVFVSVGWGLTLTEAIRWILRLSPRYRLPEPLRAAHAWAGQALRKAPALTNAVLCD